MKKVLALLIILAVSSCTLMSFAQSKVNKVNGTVSGNEKAIEAATVSLLKAKDSSLVKAAVTDKTGSFSIEKVADGKYIVMIQAIGYQNYYSEGFEFTPEKTTYTLRSVSLKLATTQVGSVVVTSKKAFIEQKIDKTLVNVDASPTNVGLTAMDVLEKSPGISVDKDGNISVKGKQGVLILVDGKPTYLSAIDLANMLKNMSSSNLDQIEIMSNPPAKYDAAGNSGVINIKTKKSKIKGFNGSITLGGGMGKNPKVNNSANLNYRTGKVNIFGNYSYSYNEGYRNMNIIRKFYNQEDELASIFNQTTLMSPKYQNHNFKIGADFYATKKTTLGVVVNGFVNPGSFNSTNTTNIFDAKGVLDSVTLANNSSKERWNNIGANFNLRHVFDTSGTELTTDLDYIHYNSSSNQLFNNSFYNQIGGKVKSDEILRGDLPSNINIYSAKVDFTHPMKKGAKLEAGIKSSYVKTDNNAQYANLIDNDWQVDEGRSNHFVYTENINAAYVNVSKPLSKKWSGQLGLRLENTISKGNQLTTNTTFDRNYTQLFPTAFLGFNPNEKNQFALSYGRRIQRPDYEDLNPFYYFLDKYTYQVGNPYLKPQFSHNIELNHTYKGFLTTSLSYSQTNDIIQEVLEQIDSLHTSYVKRDNIAKQNNVNLSVSAMVPVTKFWKANIYAQGNYNRFKGFVNNGNIDVDGMGFMTNISNQFTLKKGWGFELSGFYRSKMVMGTLVGNSMGVINFGASKQVMKNKGTIRLNVRDFANLQHFSGYSRYQNVDVTLNNHWDNRVVNVSFTYRFSKGQVGQQRQRGGANDEANRVKTGNN
ncbi:MAG: TonB-dependent receptor domain-containing protein [Ilyomonas sp.]